MIALADPRSFETVTGTGMPSAMLVVFGAYLVVGLSFYVWYAIALSKLFPRLGEEGWKGWIPVLNEATVLTLGGKPAWNAVLLFIPIVQLYGLYVKIVAVHRINQRFDRGAGTTVLAVLLPPAWATLLAIGTPPYPEGDRLAGIRPGPLRKPADAGPVDSHGYLAPPILPPGSVAPPAQPHGGAGSAPSASGASPHAAASAVPPLAPPLEPAPAGALPAPAGAPPAPAGAPLAPGLADDSATLIESVPWTSGQPKATAPAPPPPAPATSALHPAPAAPAPAAPAPAAPAPAAPAPASASGPAAVSAQPAAAPTAPAPSAAPLVHAALAPAAPAEDSTPSADAATADTVDAPPAALRARGTDSPFAPPSDASSARPVTRADLAAQLRPAPAPLTTPASSASAGAAAVAADDEEFDATVVVSRRRGARRVLVLDDGRRFALSATSIVIGRNPEGQPGEQRLPIPDRTRTLSKTHARLVVQGDEWRLTDLQSTNGVVVVADDGAETLLDPGESVIGAGRFILGEVGMHVAVESGS